MGVYINMEMPKKGCIKMLVLLCDGKVIETTPGCQPQPEEQNYKAVPIPPHGDLIDRDYVKEHLYACETNGRPLHKLELCELLDAINDIPAILPAEEGEA